MANLANTLKEEIVRISRKSVRQETAVLQKMSVQYRRSIAELKRRVAELEKKIGIIEKPVLGKTVTEQVQGQPAEVGTLRFSAKGLATQRKRLGLSALDFGKLCGVSDQTVYNWEAGRTRPMAAQLAVIVAVRTMGKREAVARIETLA